MPIFKNIVPPDVPSRLAVLFIALAAVLALCLGGGCPWPCCSAEVAGEGCSAGQTLAHHDGQRSPGQPALSSWLTGDKF